VGRDIIEGTARKPVTD